MTKEDSVKFSSVDSWLKQLKTDIDYSENNLDQFIDDFQSNSAQEWNLEEYMYYLRILKVEDGIATARITGSKYPFTSPRVGDKVNIK